MLNIGLISFATPWVLAAGAALPIVWLLLRLTPPAVRQINFPAIRLLFDLDPTQRTSAHTPPWLLILRIGILALVILGLADPVLNLSRGEGGGPLVVVVDNGWAAASQWDERARALSNALEAADRRGQQVALLTTAPPAISDGSAPHFEPAREALAQASHLSPLPWSTDRAATVKQLRELGVKETASALWISDGVDGPGTDELAAALKQLGSLTVMDAGTMTAPLVQYAPQRNFTSSKSETSANSIEVKLRRVATDGSPQTAQTVRALDTDGQVLGRALVTLPAGETSGAATLALPSELANRIVRFDVEGVATAATTILADDHWQRRPVGVASATVNGIRAPLLENAYYIEEALTPFADVRSGTLDELFERPLAVLIMADGGRILDGEVGRLTGWLENGGLLVRFAGPELEGNVDPLLPVKLRAGGRTFGGTMSWSTPATLAPFPENSPFKDILVPGDVTVSTQVLAEPSADLTTKTWARLRDGTPLVTAQRQGQGWVVLFHVSATPEWSKLPLSGLFVDLLRRLVDISRGVQGDATADVGTGALAPHLVLDGLGRLVNPGPTLAPIAAEKFADAVAGPQTPPGLYGPPGGTRALNLASSLATLQPLTQFPIGTTRASFESVTREQILKPWLLALALALLLADLLISFVLRKLMPDAPRIIKASAAAIIAIMIMQSAPPAHAADAARRSSEIDPLTRAGILETRLAYIGTGSTDVDRVAAAGLDALTKLLAARTAAEMAQAVRIDLSAATTPDALVPYPLIYWRVTSTQKLPPDRAIAAVNTYLRRGGMMIFDAPDQAGAIGGGGNGAVRTRLDEILRNLDIPPVVTIGENHVLNRSFYLMHELPGRYADVDVLVERGSAANDGASSVIIGGNDWASAWAKEANGLPMFAAVPGGENQREMAYRAGVNMVMYALSGNYKADQVHVPAIMQRLTQ